MQIIKNRLKLLGLADSTIKTYTAILNAFFKHIGKVKGFTEQDIINYLEYLLVVKNYKARSTNLIAKIIRFYCREFLGFEPKIRKIKEDKPIPKICEDEDFIQILSVTPNIKHRLCLMLMRYSGLRRCEVIKVMKHHIQDDGRLLIKCGKGAKDRYTIMPPQVLEQMKKYISLLSTNSPYVFQGITNKSHYNKRTPEQILKNAFKKLRWDKEKWFGCHALRHAFTIWMIDIVRLDYDEVSKMLGHSVRQTTQIYTQCRILNLKRAVELCREVSISV